MKTSDFNYHLPPEYIAQTPIEQRDRSRLMVLHRANSSIEHRHFYEIANFLQSGDTVVLNNSRVIPARILGRKEDSGTEVEILLLRRLDNSHWVTLVRPARKAVIGAEVKIAAKLDDIYTEITAEVLEHGENGTRVMRFSDESLLEKLGQVPLPPYIHVPLTDPTRYQTVFAKIDGSVAAPTAGFHFTQLLLNKLQRKGVNLAFITLHVGLDTFRPVRVDDPRRHPIHREFGEISPGTASMLNRTKKQGKKIMAVGTSTVRLIESATHANILQPFTGWVDLFILPGHRFCMTDAMVTNFHLPRSTLLMLVSAFAGKDFILQAYEQAKNFGYRFYSFGDAMLIL